QDDRQTGLPDGPPPAPLRAARLERGHHRDPLLDHPGDLCGRRPGHLLCRVGGLTVSDHISGHASGHASHRTSALTSWESAWSGLRAVVTGLGVSGFAAADALLERGARVIVVDAGNGTQEQSERARILEILDADVRIGPEHVSELPRFTDQGVTTDPDLVVTSPGWRPDQPVLAAAVSRGIPIWGEVELAWRMRPTAGGAPWLTVTGTNGKTTTVQMLAAMLRAAGLRTIAAG